ncbi:MAG: ABC transporter substrate-binding protein [Deltaproteobacteria bacterium]|nr:ABC transporter substrate-binding protein [Deltaproteobacteria bacterium]
MGGLTTVPARADTLRLAYPTQPKSLDPQQYPPDPAAWPIIMTSYRRLFDLKPGTTELDNAESAAVTYRVSDDGLIYTITLREGRTFTDGTPVDSRAALYTFDRLMAGQTGKTFFPFLKYMEILGPHTFRLYLTQPFPPFLASLTTPMASLISPGLERQGTGYLDKATLGSGRFVIDEIKPGQISLKLRLDLPSIPRLDRVEFLYEPKDPTRFDLVSSGAVHLAWGVGPPAGYAGPAKGLMAPSFETRYLAFNMTRPYLKMIGVREALANLARVTLQSPVPAGRPTSVFPAGFAPRASLSEGFDPESLEKRASVNLSQIGPSRVPLDLAFHSTDPGGKADAERLAERYSAFNIPVRLVPLTGAHGKGILEKADWDLLIDFRRPEFPSPEMWLGRFLDSRSSVAGNPARFENQDADAYINELNLATPADRDMTLRRLAMLATQEKPYVMLYQRLIPLAVDPRLETLLPHPMWPEVWPVEATNLDPFRNSPAAPAGPPVEVGPLIKGFDDPVAEPYE